MSVLPIVGLNRNTLEMSGTALRQKSSPLDAGNSLVMSQAQQLIQDMFETMYSTPWGGVGLAAPQVGVLWRLAIVDADRFADKLKSEKRAPFVLINPEITDTSEEKEIDREACLSLSFWAGKVERSRRILVKYIDHLNNECNLEAEGYLARVIQHEIDHLDGIIYADRLGDYSKLFAGVLPGIRERDTTLARLYPEVKSTTR